MINNRGSHWNKWDLHVHTPASLVHNYQGEDPWKTFIEELAALPPEFKVIGINDYLFLDGYKRVVAEKQAGKLPNIELLLPVIELRLDKFGGTKSALSRVNYHIIFSDEIPPEVIETQFLGALCSKYQLSPEHDHIRTTGKWAAVPTRDSLIDLGNKIIQSVPEDQKKFFNSPLLEGFNNLCISLPDVEGVLASHYFHDKVITPVGKTEWADVKWTDQSIAEKKTIINGADLVFTASASVEDYVRARSSLTSGTVNDRILDCSDAHAFSSSEDKDRLANCNTWIKADTTFEGLKQAIYEFETRVRVSIDRPLEPILQLQKAVLSFPEKTELIRNDNAETFCLRGHREISFSPHLTCIIGGRGTGKSTLLNLLHERLQPRSTEFFQQNTLSPATASVPVNVELFGINQGDLVEFLQQNEIEQFASEHARLTAAVYARLKKLDSDDEISESENAIIEARRSISALMVNDQSQISLRDEIVRTQVELSTQRGFLSAFNTPEFKQLMSELTHVSTSIHTLKASKQRYGNLTSKLRDLISSSASVSYRDAFTLNDYDFLAGALVESVAKSIDAQGRLQNRVEEDEAKLEARSTRLRGQLRTYLSERRLSEESLSDIGKATEKIAELEVSLEKAKRSLSEAEKKAEQITYPTNLLEKHIELTTRQLAPINSTLSSQGSQVKPIALIPYFNHGLFRDNVIAYIAKSVVDSEDRAFRTDYCQSKLKSVDFSQSLSQEEALLLIPEDQTLASRALRELFGNSHKFRQLQLFVEQERLAIETYLNIEVHYDGKPVAQSSFGQRCTAVIVVLLLLGNTPIVIDEPEAHLDSGLIAKYLVNLIKNKKLHRQMIFATHNANFVINGDAELIHCLSMDENKKTVITSTTIEDLRHRSLLLDLEGGEEAFQQRERRYGIE